MRLSDLLNKAPDTSKVQVEGFLGHKKVPWGQHKVIQVGKIIRNYSCSRCKEVRTFISGERLSCLVTGDSSVSIDATLQCSACKASIEVWFVIGCNDLFSQVPVVHLERFTENRRNPEGGAGWSNEKIDDLFKKAHIAFNDHLGAGAMIYLRKIFEISTLQTATAIGIQTTRSNGRRKDFKTLLKEVDDLKHIIPVEFSSNGYRLFSELSEIIHGESDEVEALNKYEPCQKLVHSIVNNIRSNHDIEKAVNSLNWNAITPAMTEEEVAP